MDGQTFERIETYGVDRWLGELADKLKEKSYTPQPAKRVMIPKPDGKQRPLGIPCLKDRGVQMAAVLILEPIFEPDLPDEKYGHCSEPERTPRRAENTQLAQGYKQIVDADLSGYLAILALLHP